MPDHDRLTLFAVPATLQAATEEIARRALAAPPVCRHAGAALVSALDPDRGTWCAALPCGYEPLASLLADPLCSLCGEAFAADGLTQLGAQLGDDHVTVVARLCPACLRGDHRQDVQDHGQAQHPAPATEKESSTMTAVQTTAPAPIASLGVQPITPGAAPCDLCGVPRRSNDNYSGLGLLCRLCRPQLAHPALGRDWGGIALLAALKISVGTNPDALHDLEAVAAEHGAVAWRDSGQSKPPADRFGWISDETLDACRTDYLTRYEQRRTESGKVEARCRQAQQEDHAADMAGRMHR